MATKLQVWKQALVHLEKATIVSLSSDVEARYVFDEAWPGVVEEALNEGDWNFAKKSAAMAVNVIETPITGWTYVLDYPEDYVRTLGVSPNPFFNSRYYDFADVGGFLYSNTNVLYLQYISSSFGEDASVDLWPTLFWRYVAMKLAYETCGKLTGGSSLRDDLEKRAQKALRKAKNIDARNENNKTVPPGSWITARHGWAGGGHGIGGVIVGGEIVPEEGDV